LHRHVGLSLIPWCIPNRRDAMVKEGSDHGVQGGTTRQKCVCGYGYGYGCGVRNLTWGVTFPGPYVCNLALVTCIGLDGKSGASELSGFRKKHSASTSSGPSEKHCASKLRWPQTCHASHVSGSREKCR
jgi:hypothetical protein